MNLTQPTKVSIAIATLNRRDDLRETLNEIGRLSPAPFEVLVCLDGCIDGSRDLIEEFSTVRFLEHEKPQGSVASRDELFRLASGDLIVSLDDDSSPTQTDFVTRLVRLAEDHPEAAVFALQEVRDPGREDRLFLPPSRQCYISSYPNCAGAIRKTIYGSTASYPRIFEHMYEEPDFCLQTYASGFAVLYDPSITIRHRYSPVGRNMMRRHHQHSRNEFWSVLLRCPMPHVFWVAPYRVVRQFIYAGSNGFFWILSEPKWWAKAFRGLPVILTSRRPVPWTVYWGWISLGRNPAKNFNELKRRFPNIKSTQLVDSHDK